MLHTPEAKVGQRIAEYIAHPDDTIKAGRIYCVVVLRGDADALAAR